jgi:predicted aconitase with swiveling domain
MNLLGRTIFHGTTLGEALVSMQPISFFGGVDPDSGIVVEHGHPLEGQSISGKILIFPTGKGSTVGSYTLYRLKMNGLAPRAILNVECETIIAVGCIIAEIPCVDQLPIQEILSGSLVQIDGSVVIIKDPAIH